MEDNSISFHQLLDAFDFPPAAYPNLKDFAVAHDMMIDGTFSHLREQADLLASETFGTRRPSAVTESAVLGENCIGEDDDEQECLIPQEWKSVPTMMESMDVMEFLGITRVRPLVVSTTIFRDS